jgi:hypothetical protein
VPDPDPRIPSYSHTENWRPDEDDIAASQHPSNDDFILRVVSVIPFVLIAAFGVIALVGWFIVVVFGVEAPGNPDAQPIWRWAQGESFSHVLSQVGLAVVIGLIPLVVTVLAGWATVHGFRSRPHHLFWPIAELFWGIVATAMVVLSRSDNRQLAELKLSGLDKAFLFGAVLAAVVVAGMRVRRLRRQSG